jgi:hypothetical protein
MTLLNKVVELVKIHNKEQEEYNNFGKYERALNGAKTRILNSAKLGNTYTILPVNEFSIYNGKNIELYLNKTLKSMGFEVCIKPFWVFWRGGIKVSWKHAIEARNE